MILDSSVVIAVILREPGYERFVEAMEAAESLAIGTPTLGEAGIVLLHRLGAAGASILSRFVERNRIVEIPFEGRHREAMIDASIRFGKGRHPAALNYGDCMTYAIARLAGVPLLFAGEDFAKTDLPPALD